MDFYTRLSKSAKDESAADDAMNLTPMQPEEFPELHHMDFAKKKEQYQKTMDKLHEDDPHPETDPKNVEKVMKGPAGEFSRSLLNIDTIIELDSNCRILLGQFGTLQTEWEEVYDKWKKQEKAYKDSYGKIQDSLWSIFQSVVINLKANRPTAVSPELLMALEDAKERKKIMDSYHGKLNEIQAKSTEIFNNIMKTLHDGRAHIIEHKEEVDGVVKKVIRVLMAVYKITPGEDKKIHLASLNAVFAKMEEKSQEASAFITELRNMLKDERAKMLQEYARGEELGRHLLYGDEALLAHMVETGITSGSAAVELKELLESKTDKKEKAEGEKEKAEPATTTSKEAPVASEAIGEEEKIRQMIEKSRRRSASLSMRAYGKDFVEKLEEIDKSLKKLNHTVDQLNTYCDSAIHQLDAKGIEVDVKNVKVKEELPEGDVALQTA